MERRDDKGVSFALREDYPEGATMNPPQEKIRIVSGGQTGADRAALDFAIAHGIPHSGWCPKGRKAEDGIIDERYQLTETGSEYYVQRTEWNVRDSDGTVVFSISKTLTGGSRKTAEFARQYRKPFIHISKESARSRESIKSLREFIKNHRIKILNIAGPRASTEAEVGGFVRNILAKTLGNL